MDLLSMLNAPTTVVVTGTLFLATFLLYRWLLPKPIPGVPYNPEATKTLWGDIPSMLEHMKTHKMLTDWMLAHNTKHDSPMVQLFTNLFGKPILFISDYRETQDIVLRRTKEFDKPDLISNAFYGIAPEFHAVLETGDQWRYQRKLIQDLMTPTFLNEVAAPQLHDEFMDLVNLWSEKMRLGEGRPFTVRHDIYDTSLEAIWAALFGIEGIDTVTRNNIDLLSPKTSLALPSSTEKEVEFPRAPAPPAFQAIFDLTDSIEAVLKSPLPRLTGFVQRYLPAGWKSLNLKTKFVTEEIAKAEARIKANQGKETKITNAMDHILRRENIAAEKLDRAPIYYSKTLVSEIFGLLVAGHDTTSTTLLWAVKYLATHQSVQTKLRSTLRSTFATAHSSKRAPNAQEIATSQIHYLDACIEEILRVATTGSLVSRTAMQDAVVLGQVIPKGTMIMCAGAGAGILEPTFPIDEKLRSQYYHKAGGGKIGAWDTATMQDFLPERWLVHDKNSNEMVFDGSAGPHVSFGGGLRGCYGKKMAYLELRMAIVLALWHFELKEVPEEYASFEGMDGLTHSPIQCYVRLAKAE